MDEPIAEAGSWTEEAVAARADVVLVGAAGPAAGKGREPGVEVDTVEDGGVVAGAKEDGPNDTPPGRWICEPPLEPAPALELLGTAAPATGACAAHPPVAVGERWMKETEEERGLCCGAAAVETCGRGLEEAIGAGGVEGSARVVRAEAGVEEDAEGAEAPTGLGAGRTKSFSTRPVRPGWGAPCCCARPAKKGFWCKGGISVTGGRLLFIFDLGQ